MANYNRQVFFGDNLAHPTTGLNVGPFTISPCRKLTSVSASMGFTFPGVTIAPNAEIAPIVAWGVQQGPQGYSPAFIPASIGSFSYLWSENSPINGFGTASWTPDTSDAAYLGAGSVSRDWNGQLFVNGPVDLYLSAAALVTGAPVFAITYTVAVTYSF